jgi:hypothetical protein
MGFLLHPAVPYVSSVLSGGVLLGFGLTYILYPRLGYSYLRLSFVPSNFAEWEVIEHMMFLSGAKDVFIAVVIFASMWFGTDWSFGIISMGYGANSILDGWLLKEVRTNDWSQWGYGSFMVLVGAMNLHSVRERRRAPRVAE